MIGGLAGLAGFVVWPFHDGVQRYGLILSFTAAWTAGLWFLRRRKVLRIVVLALPVLMAAPFCLPGKPIDARKLRERYVATLGEGEGALYLWGGEGHHATDCSGLPRRALRDALWAEGWENRNGAVFREWARQWWFDTSAKALGENYRGFTWPLGIAGK